MKILEHELHELRAELTAMADLVHTQIVKCKEAFEKYDMDLASEIIHSEKKVNSYELKIDKDCENILALHTPVANDLKFVIAALKISYNLERIGDHVVALAKYIRNITSPLSPELVSHFRILETIDLALEMVDITIDSIKSDDSKEVRKLFLLDDSMDEVNDRAASLAVELIAQNEDPAKCIAALSIIRKLERVGDHTTNIAEELIFYTDAKVIKHNRKRIEKIKVQAAKMLDK